MNEVRKLLIGTLVRGIMWAAAGLASYLGCETISEDVAEGIAIFGVAAILAVVSMFWSKKKDAKLNGKNL